MSLVEFLVQATTYILEVIGNNEEIAGLAIVAIWLVSIGLLYTNESMKRR